jgi:hypothetical protein
MMNSMAQAFDTHPVAGARNGERNMQIIEYQYMVVDMDQPLGGERVPAFSDIGPRQFQAPKQGGGVDKVEQEVACQPRRNVLIVVGQHFIETSLLDQV